MNTTSSKYDEQAQEFVDRFGFGVRATFKGGKCPAFCDGKHVHGDCYRITIYRRSDYVGNENLEPKRLTFEFWNSLNDKQNSTPVSAYDVLSCVASDSSCPDTFEDFCAEYGFDEDSRKALATFKKADAFASRIRAFFTPSELDALAEIQ